MDIEPLKKLLSYSNDKKDTILTFLDKSVREKVIKLEYEDEKFYINVLGELNKKKKMFYWVVGGCGWGGRE